VDEFDVDDIDNDPYDTDFCSDSDPNLSDDDLEPRYKRSHMHRKKVTEHVPPGPTAKPQVPSTLDALAKQLNDEIQAVKNKQEAMLPEFTAMTPTPAYRTWNDDPIHIIYELPRLPQDGGSPKFMWVGPRII
jgi:hypothetical protein